MGDIRYKISAALHDAGINNKTYANQVVKGIGATRQLNKVVQNQGTKGLF